MKKTQKWLVYPLAVLASVPLIFNNYILVFVFSNILFAYFIAGYGLKFTWPAAILFALAVYYLCDATTAIYLSFYLLPALILGVSMYHKLTFSSLLLGTCAAEIFAMAFHTVTLAKGLNQKPSDILFLNFLEEIKRGYNAAPLLGPEAGIDSQILFNQIANLLQSMLPCFYIIAALLFVYILFSLVRFLLKRSRVMFPNLPLFHELSLPGSFSLIFAILFIISFFADSFILSNVISVVYAVHVFCGLSSFDYLLIRLRFPKFARLAILFSVVFMAAFLGGMVSTILCFFGMNDSSRRARK